MLIQTNEKNLTWSQILCSMICPYKNEYSVVGDGCYKADTDLFPTKTNTLEAIWILNRRDTRSYQLVWCELWENTDKTEKLLVS